MRNLQTGKVDMPTMEEAMRETLAMVISHQTFCITKSIEVAAPSNMKLLQNFLFSGVNADAELFKLAAQSQLSNPEVIESQVLRMLQDEGLKTLSAILHFSGYPSKR